MKPNLWHDHLPAISLVLLTLQRPPVLAYVLHRPLSRHGSVKFAIVPGVLPERPWCIVLERIAYFVSPIRRQATLVCPVQVAYGFRCLLRLLKLQF